MSLVPIELSFIRHGWIVSPKGVPTATTNVANTTYTMTKTATDDANVVMLSSAAQPPHRLIVYRKHYNFIERLLDRIANHAITGCCVWVNDSGDFSCANPAKLNNTKLYKYIVRVFCVMHRTQEQKKGVRAMPEIRKLLELEQTSFKYTMASIL